MHRVFLYVEIPAFVRNRNSQTLMQPKCWVFTPICPVSPPQPPEQVLGVCTGFAVVTPSRFGTGSCGLCCVSWPPLSMAEDGAWLGAEAELPWYLGRCFFWAARRPARSPRGSVAVPVTWVGGSEPLSWGTLHRRRTHYGRISGLAVIPSTAAALPAAVPGKGAWGGALPEWCAGSGHSLWTTRISRPSCDTGTIFLLLCWAERGLLQGARADFTLGVARVISAVIFDGEGCPLKWVWNSEYLTEHVHKIPLVGWAEDNPNSWFVLCHLLRFRETFNFCFDLRSAPCD